MKFKINDIEYCKNNSDCYRPWSCNELCKSKFDTFEKNYSETIDLTLPSIDFKKDYTDVLSEEYYFDKTEKINVMPLKRYNEYKESVEKFTYLYLIIKYVKETEIFEKDIQDYIIEQLNKYDNETTFETISYEEIIDIILDFNDYLPDDMLDDILLNSISKNFTDKIHIKNTKLNIVEEKTIKNILKKRKEISYRIQDGEFNLGFDDWHPCSNCRHHKYNYGKNICSLGNYCEDYDEDNPCGDISIS